MDYNRDSIKVNDAFVFPQNQLQKAIFFLMPLIKDIEKKITHLSLDCSSDKTFSQSVQDR